MTWLEAPSSLRCSASASSAFGAAREQLAAALQQQTASSEVLNVISRSPGELQPVFDTILQEATQVCQANFGLMIRYEEGSPHPIAFCARVLSTS